MPRVLLADDDANPAAGFGALQIAGAIDPQELARVRGDEFIPTGDVTERTAINVAVRKADRGMKNRDAGGAQFLQIARREAGRPNPAEGTSD